MARRSVAMRSMLLSEQPWRPFRRPILAASHSIIPPLLPEPRVRATWWTAPLRCSRGDAPSAASPSSSPLDEQGPPQEAFLKAISGESRKPGSLYSVA
ncbi:hypothetical protein B296_00011814 [Ensete ventricosum]|uniref:Uncharacterized protein n=1 Tax=Ensete ventricosum TaxID=4639 RepID=A0A427ACJ8_ENSVE|nr:hypothetical protein B296_00011814 [Ensete ventricosum]